MKAEIRLQRRRFWEKDPHCYWCGQLTRIVENNGGSVPDDAATIDHIRSRNFITRQDPGHANWQHGFRVMACFRCNNLRGNFEVEFFRAIDPEGFYRKGNAKPAAPGLLQAHGELSNAVLALVRAGGAITGPDSYLKEVYRCINRVHSRYDEKRLGERTKELKVISCRDLHAVSEEGAFRRLRGWQRIPDGQNPPPHSAGHFTSGDNQGYLVNAGDARGGPRYFFVIYDET